MYNGILVFNKPQGFTSHDVVAKLRGILRQKRIGHAGTLDPMATGVLVVLLGSATKASDDAAAQGKAYTAGLRLGTVTDTRDIWGAVLAQSAKIVESAGLERVLPSFRGQILQKPPAFSAIKIDGQKLYSLARKGIEIDAPARQITIDRLEIAGKAPDGDFLLDIECSKGTYIRSLCHDIGQALVVGACMSSLVRIRSGGFWLESALTFDEVERLHAEGALAGHLVAVERVYADLAEIRLTREGGERAKNGAFLSKKHFATGEMPASEGERVRVYTSDGELYMIGVSRVVGERMAVACHKTFAMKE